MGLEGYKPTKGKIIFNGIDITKMSITERARMGITLAWQNPATFEGVTVEKYLSLHGFDPKKALKMVGLNPREYLKRIIDENLSGGERKRIELASVISMKPKLAILDEPDSGIDFISIRKMKSTIEKIRSLGSSILLITHNEDMLMVCDRASLLCNGQIIKTGSPREIARFFKEHCKRCGHKGKIDKGVING